MAGSILSKGKQHMFNGNPFSENRAEYMKNLWKYYVPFHDSSNQVDKPIVIVGGRGTGKSMYFLCNSWRDKLAALSNASDDPINDFIKEQNIGIYYKVDSTFVGAMNSHDEDASPWQGLFNTYISICLFKELLPLLSNFFENKLIRQSDLEKIFKVYGRIVHKSPTIYNSVNEIIDDCDMVLQEIEDVINNGNSDNICFRYSQPGTIFKALIDELHKVDALSQTVFKIYIDEYEAFSEWQQKIINTLIKQSHRLLIYNIGLRFNGMKTQCTLGENEILQQTHDYLFFNFDQLILGKEYENTLRNICQKRLEAFFSSHGIAYTSQETDIEFYLSTYNTAKELERFNGKKLNFYNNLRKLIREQCAANDDIEQMESILCTNAPPVNARLHLSLLLRAPQYRPKVSSLVYAYTAWQSGTACKEASQYRDWLHNTKNGIVFLLAKDAGISKWYYGFDTFSMLSSGVVRYFLELCEQVFNIAMMDGFSWEKPCQISPEIQTRAAKYVSQNRVNEIASYPRCGKKLRIFVQCFGEICRELHRNDNTTLGEPEVNHFTTETLQLSDSIVNDINDAITWLVLQKYPQTKSKELIRTNIVDYHLNKIYAPYFEISCNRKRKITLRKEDLEKLFSENVNFANSAARSFLDHYWSNKVIISKEKVDNAISEQLTIFTEG